MDLLLKLRGASAEEKKRGVEAAKAVIDRAGITAEEAAGGFFAMEAWDDMGFPEDEEPSEAEYAAADVWGEAHTAALEACCADWPSDKKPVAVELELLMYPEEQLADRDTGLARLRAIVEAKDGHSEASNKVFMLARRVAEDLENARDLVADVTVAYTRLEHSCFDPREPVEPKRKAVLDAIDALEKATAKLAYH
ncbi:hypothetical protein [Mesorhizobium sp.]|uniref:hypothetical protein n=1 Tax=Mesorhizobium sp. TaxID=1871066 RepID=UPI000FE7E84A|nr:hypothetical protein [Mesorhizobium sp.]RWI62913.1 MAG: hypothetical protein EOR18_32310 [Mesorhizobium sp.]TJV94714.1 MAG: hypothetical protein E5X52_27410 [Mesorhizobium sp.]